MAIGDAGINYLEKEPLLPTHEGEPALRSSEDAVGDVVPQMHLHNAQNEFASQRKRSYEECYSQANELWAQAVADEKTLGTTAAMPKYEKAMGDYLSAIFFHGSRDPELDTDFYLRLAGAQTKVAAYYGPEHVQQGERSEILFSSADKAYDRALILLPEPKNEGEENLNHFMRGLIYSFKFDIHDANNSFREAREDLKVARKEIKEADISDTQAGRLLAERIQEQEAILSAPRKNRQEQRHQTGELLLSLVHNDGYPLISVA